MISQYFYEFDTTFYAYNSWVFIINIYIYIIDGISNVCWDYTNYKQ